MTRTNEELFEEASLLSNDEAVKVWVDGLSEDEKAIIEVSMRDAIEIIAIAGRLSQDYRERVMLRKKKEMFADIIREGE